MVAAPINHIGLDERGVAYIQGTRIKVRQIVVDAKSGMTPEAIEEAYEHLTLAQIFAALSYYHDHKTQIDAEIAEADRFVETMRAQNPNPLTREQFEARRQKEPNR